MFWASFARRVAWPFAPKDRDGSGSLNPLPFVISSPPQEETTMLKLWTLVLLLLLAAAPGFAQDFTTKEYREVHGKGLKRASDFRDFVRSLSHHHQLSADVIPGKVDLSAIVSPPENQGSCGSCWDFALTKALRSAWMVVGKDPGTLAFNYLLNNCGPGPSEGGCGGGDFPAGKNFLNGHGPWLESQDPYKGYGGRCKTGLSVAGTAKEMVQVGDEAPNFQLMADALAQKHVLVVDVAVCGRWGSYSGGIFNEDQCGANSIDHMVNVVGYDMQTSVDAQGNAVFDAKGQPVNGDGYLIAMNNWGANWGEKGYMRTKWGMDAIGDTTAYFTVDYTPPAPPVPPVPPVPPTPSNGVPAWAFIIGIVAILGAGVLVFELKKK